MEMWNLLREFTILIGGALLLGAFFERLRQSAILGYLLAGCFLGPGALNLISNRAVIHGMAEIGVALLLFTIGLEFSLKRLIALGRLAMGGGTIQIVVTAGLFALLGRTLGLPWNTAFAVGLLAAPSSTACVMRMLRDRSETDSVHGRNAIGILLLQDLALVPMVVLITALGRGATPGTLATEIAVAAVFFAVLVAGFYVTTTYVLPRAYWAVLLLRNREILILLATLMALAAMWTAHLLSVSPALGAFIAGMLLAESPFAAQIRSDIGTLRVIFVTLFFTSVGMLADIPWILQNWAIVLAAVVLVIFLKSVIIGVIMRGYGQPLAQSVATGICLAQIGEFSFMLAEIGLQVGAITEQVYSQAVSVSVVTLLLTPLLVSNAPRAGWAAASRRKRGGNGGDSSPAALPQTPAVDGMVLIIGFGPAGQSVANSMREAKVPFLVVELNPATVAQARREGMLAEVGDATHEEVLRHLEVARARAVVLTLPDHRAGLDIVRTIHGFAPGVPLIVRSRYHRFAKDFTDAGATFVIDEEIQVGIFLGELLARGLTRRLL